MRSLFDDKQSQPKYTKYIPRIGLSEKVRKNLGKSDIEEATGCEGENPRRCAACQIRVQQQSNNRAHYATNGRYQLQIHITKWLYFNNTWNILLSTVLDG